jgi:hypothetical protein
MTVSELTAPDADAVLRRMYYTDHETPFDYYQDDEEHWEELAYSLSSNYSWDAIKNIRVQKDPGEDFENMRIVCIEDFGGEGQGDKRYVVFKFSDESGVKYFRKDGYYASYDGSTWDGDFREVKPVDRVVTFYE